MCNEYEIHYNIEKITIADIARLKRIIDKPSPELSTYTIEHAKIDC